MKRIILIAIIATISKFSVAQVSFGFQAGANIGMGKLKFDDAYFAGSTSYSQKNKTKVGFLAGFIAEIPLGTSLAFRPELNFNQEGTKQSFTVTGFGSYAAEQKVTLNYIQLPLNVVYKMPLGDGSLFFGLGPCLQFGISGKNKYTSSTDPTDNKDYDVTFDGKKSEGVTDPTYYDKVHLKRVDVGINVLAGYKLGMGLFAKVGFNNGLLELSPDKSDPNPSNRFSYKNSGVNFSIGYMLGGKTSKKAPAAKKKKK